MPGTAKVGSVLLDEQTIRTRTAELGACLTSDYHNKSPVFIGVLSGAAIFLADLVRTVSLDLQIDFISVASYGRSSETSRALRLRRDLEIEIEGMDVVIVEDIVDTGLTVSYLVQEFEQRRPASVKVCALLDKPSRREVPVKIDYVGFEIPDRFVVGWGLDYGELYRNLSFVAALNEA